MINITLVRSYNHVSLCEAIFSVMYLTSVELSSCRSSLSSDPPAKRTVEMIDAQ